MRVIGIIAEFNPFHSGHEYLIREARKATGDDRAVVMCIMSGSFTQRGLPAIFPRHLRARQALKCGADIVIELPVEWSCAPAGEFAEGAIRTLMATGVVTDICWGIDTDDPGLINTLSDPAVYDSDDYKTILREKLSEGMSFPAASAAAVTIAAGLSPDNNAVSECLRSPNSILAIEYMKAMKRLGAGFKVHMIRRIGQDYSDESRGSEIPSAGAIRKAIYGTDLTAPSIASACTGSMPDRSLSVILSAVSSGEASPADLNMYMEEAYLRVISSETENIRFMADGLSGYIENVFSGLKAGDISFERISSLLATKHFTMPRIYRALSMAMLGVEKDQISYGPKYIRVLGFGHEGRYCLKIMGRCAKLPIISNRSDLLELISSDGDLKRSYELNSAALDLSGHFMGIRPGSSWNDPPVKVK